MQKFYYDPKKFVLEKYQYGYKKNAKFHADFKFVNADLKVHKNENFFGFDFEFCTISLLVMSKY